MSLCGEGSMLVCSKMCTHVHMPTECCNQSEENDQVCINHLFAVYSILTQYYISFEYKPPLRLFVEQFSCNCVVYP